MGTLLAEGSTLTKMWISPPVKRGAQEKRGWGKRESENRENGEETPSPRHDAAFASRNSHRCDNLP